MQVLPAISHLHKGIIEAHCSLQHTRRQAVQFIVPLPKIKGNNNNQWRLAKRETVGCTSTARSDGSRASKPCDAVMFVCANYLFGTFALLCLVLLYSAELDINSRRRLT